MNNGLSTSELGFRIFLPALLLLLPVLAYGWYLGREQRLTAQQVVLLPFVLTGISLASLVQTFGLDVRLLAAYGGGFAAAAGLLEWLQVPRGVRREGRQFQVPASWLPLSLMVLLFGTSFTVRVATRLRPMLLADLLLPLLASAVFGFAAGAFAARAWRIFRAPA